MNKVAKKLFAITTACLMVFNTGFSNIPVSVFANEGSSETTTQVQEQTEEQTPVTDENTGGETGSSVDMNTEVEQAEGSQATEEHLGNEPNKETQSQETEESKEELPSEITDSKGMVAKLISNNGTSMVYELYSGRSKEDFYRSANKSARAYGHKIRVDIPYGAELPKGDKWRVESKEGIYIDGVQYKFEVYAPLWITDVRTNVTKHVYCIEPNVLSIGGASDYTNVSFGDYNFSAATEKKMRYIVTLGYGWGNDWSQEMDFATQIAIWNTVKPGLIYGLHPDIQAKYNALMNRVNMMYTDVSFNGTTVKLQGLGEKYAVTLEDTNKVFSEYCQEPLPDGIHVSHNGNKLKVWVSKEFKTESDPIYYNAFYLKDKANPNAASIVYDSPTSQDVADIPGYPDPMSLDLYVKTELPKPLTIGKQDEDGTMVPGTTFKVGYSTDGKDVTNLLVNPDTGSTDWVTGDSGTVTIPSAYTDSNGTIYGLNEGTVYVKEVSVPVHLVLDKSVHTVTLSREVDNSWTAENDWKKGYIQVQKRDSHSNKVVIASSTTFEVHDESQNGKVVATIKTDEKGIAKTDLLRYGHYYLTEKDSPLLTI